MSIFAKRGFLFPVAQTITLYIIKLLHSNLWFDLPPRVNFWLHLMHRVNFCSDLPCAVNWGKSDQSQELISSGYFKATSSRIRLPVKKVRMIEFMNILALINILAVYVIYITNPLGINLYSVSQLCQYIPNKRSINAE